MSTYSDDVMNRAMRQDPLADAEKICGKSYKEDGATMALGLGLQLRKNDAVRRMMETSNDMHFSCDLAYAERVLRDCGAERVYQTPIVNERSGVTDYLNIWWGRGILYVYDTYWGDKSISGGKFYYNWRPKPDMDWRTRCECTSSGGMSKQGVWAGDHDIREGVKLAIRNFQKHGELLEKWESVPYLWLCHYGEKAPEGLRGDAWMKFYDDIRQSRFAELPEFVRQAMGDCK